MTSLLSPRAGLLMLLATALVFSEGCRAVEGIFKAGFWVGIIAAVVVVGSVIGLFKAIGS